MKLTFFETAIVFQVAKCQEAGAIKLETFVVSNMEKPIWLQGHSFVLLVDVDSGAVGGFHVYGQVHTSGVTHVADPASLPAAFLGRFGPAEILLF